VYKSGKAQFLLKKLKNQNVNIISGMMDKTGWTEPFCEAAF